MSECADKICIEETEFEKTINHIFETRRSGEAVSVVVDDKTETTKTTKKTIANINILNAHEKDCCKYFV